MVIVNSYALAVFLCFIIMLCWGSWGNTQKLAAKSWRYELFYWDYVIGMVLFALLLALTLGSFGSDGESFFYNISHISLKSVGWILLGGIIFNASNILLSASTSIAGMSVAFPLGVGIALVLGVINNYITNDKGNAALLAIGVALVVVAIICNGIASGKKGESNVSKADQKKGVILALIAGIVMSFFSSFVMRGMGNVTGEVPFVHPYATPYTASVIFTLGVLLSNFLFNTLVMRKPFVGEPVTYKQYFAGNAKTHLVGMLGGAIWCLGTALSYITSKAAGPAVSYALGQGAPMIAAIWGVFVWKEFKGSDKKVYGLLGLMFLFFIVGLSLIVVAGL
ncbi:MAG: multidrug DMT transporter permease [Bacteroidales bacterium]|jgi:glucose uptake protein|nr:multidrug DMT transporter permease [Bacteroidales bacterium]